MDYEIAFDQEEGSYRVFADIEFSAIAEWVSEHLTNKETVQRVWQAVSLAEKEDEYPLKDEEMDWQLEFFREMAMKK